MKVLVIYDSFFGNTEKIAAAISAAIAKASGDPAEVDLLKVSEVKPEQLAGVELLIVGSPTRGFQASEATTAFLKGLPDKGLKGIKAAAFDTRLSLEDIESSAVRFIVKTGGYAAKRIAEALKKKGGALVAPPEGFYVTGEQGPLKEGELERAAEWGSVMDK
jgi:flavodoxin I